MNKKLIIAIVVLVCLGVGLIKYKEYRVQEANRIITYTVKPTYTNTPSITPDISNPDSVVQTYYNRYDVCIKRNFELPDSQEVNCLDNEVDFLTESLITRLKQNVGSDPRLCASNTPAKITYENAEITGAHATVIVHTHWGGSPRRNIKVEVERQNNEWKISDIICTRPNIN